MIYQTDNLEAYYDYQFYIENQMLMASTQTHMLNFSKVAEIGPPIKAPDTGQDMSSNSASLSLPKNYEEDGSPAKGILIGICLSIPLWVGIILVVHELI